MLLSFFQNNHFIIVFLFLFLILMITLIAVGQKGNWTDENFWESAAVSKVVGIYIITLCFLLGYSNKGYFDQIALGGVLLKIAMARAAKIKEFMKETQAFISKGIKGITSENKESLNDSKK